jgi:1,4-alpha-glucan branching enzyme
MKNRNLRILTMPLIILLMAFSPYARNQALETVYYSNLRFLKKAEAPRHLTVINTENLSRDRQKIMNGILFTYRDRRAQEAAIAGSFSNWKVIPMQRSENGIWYYFLESGENTDTIKYKFTIDSIWIPDPLNSFRENDSSGSYVSVAQPMAPYQSTQVTYRILKGNTVEFRIFSPEARLVSLVGDFNNWNPENDLLRRKNDGIWRLRKKLSPGTYRYQFIIDGRWSPDTYNPGSASTINGGICSLITIR